MVSVANCDVPIHRHRQQTLRTMDCCLLSVHDNHFHTRYYTCPIQLRYRHTFHSCQALCPWLVVRCSGPVLSYRAGLLGTVASPVHPTEMGGKFSPQRTSEETPGREITNNLLRGLDLHTHISPRARQPSALLAISDTSNDIYLDLSNTIRRASGLPGLHDNYGPQASSRSKSSYRPIPVSLESCHSPP